MVTEQSSPIAVPNRVIVEDSAKAKTEADILIGKLKNINSFTSVLPFDVLDNYVSLPHMRSFMYRILRRIIKMIAKIMLDELILNLYV